MSNVILSVKSRVNKKELLNEIKSEAISDGVNLEVNIEETKSTISAAPITGQEMQKAVEYIIQLLNAESIIRISFESVIGNIAWNYFQKIKNRLLPLIASNNKKKGNAWGAKIEIKRNINKNQTQFFVFFLDNISEGSIYDAISKIESKIKQLSALLGDNYLNHLKNIGFTFNELTMDWELMGAERFDGILDILNFESKK